MFILTLEKRKLNNNGAYRVSLNGLEMLNTTSWSTIFYVILLIWISPRSGKLERTVEKNETRLFTIGIFFFFLVVHLLNSVTV